MQSTTDVATGAVHEDPTHVVVWVHPNSHQPARWGYAVVPDDEAADALDIIRAAMQTSPHAPLPSDEDVAEVAKTARVFRIDEERDDHTPVVGTGQ